MTKKCSAVNKHLNPRIFFSLCTIHILKPYEKNHIKRQIQALWTFILKCNVGPGPALLDVCPWLFMCRGFLLLCFWFGRLWFTFSLGIISMGKE